MAIEDVRAKIEAKSRQHHDDEQNSKALFILDMFKDEDSKIDKNVLFELPEDEFDSLWMIYLSLHSDKDYEKLAYSYAQKFAKSTKNELVLTALHNKLESVFA